ncbi:MAG: hypothetical protein MUF49_10495 [Oculatellaceae cyanobacterium Prado106]|jgi:hypothetical protein|nr:hypothetical protein [Oculatellaceae cyanobacterium Prado106]
MKDDTLNTSDEVVNPENLEQPSSPEDSENDALDHALVNDLRLPFHQLIWELVDTEMAIADPTSGMAQIIEQVDIDMPVEIYIEVDDQGQVHLTGSPPTQRTETTFLPIFHQMKLRISRDEEVGLTESPIDPAH